MGDGGNHAGSPQIDARGYADGGDDAPQPAIPANIPTGGSRPRDCFPEEGGEVAIAAVRPYKCNIVPATGPRGTTREYLPCPKWLEDLLTDCIDPVSLRGD